MKKFLVLIGIVIAGVLGINLIANSTTATESKLVKSVNAIPGRYIVVLEESAFPESDLAQRAESASFELAGTYGANIDSLYKDALYGFAGEMSEKTATELSRDKRVKYVEEDAYISGSSLQSNATWGLDRIDQRGLPINTSYQYTSTGAGVHAYILDSGIRTTHQDFNGRASVGADFIGDGQNGNDCYGHGTHVAGTVGSTTYGVAKGVSLHAVRVLGCDGGGSVSGLISGVNWVTSNRILPAVANISITLSGPSTSLDTAVNNSISSGVTYTTAAGNFGMDACNFSPGRNPNIITVGASMVSGLNDFRPGFSNFGPCVDLFAPGHTIMSLSHGDDVSLRAMHGTSMAAPHVAGVAALYLQTHPSASAATVSQAITDGATTGTITNIDATSPNKELYTWIGGSVPPPLPAQITIIKQVTTAQGGTASQASFSYSATNLDAASFALVDNNAPPADRFIDSNVVLPEAAGDVLVTEAAATGWTLSSIDCVETSTGGMPTLQNSTVDLSARRATIKAEAGELVTCTFVSQELIPTAAPANITGRVVDTNGRGMRGIVVYIQDLSSGELRVAMTSSFGYYGFEGMSTNVLYSVGISVKRYTFSPASRTLFVSEDVSGLDFARTLQTSE